jgi:hypothetical protein
MESTLFEIGESLKACVTALLVPIQTTRAIDEDAFRALHEQALRLVRACKGRDEVPKGLLRELHATFSILRAEAEHFGTRRRELEEMANDIEVCFGLILGDEVPEDRRPGVPRII